MKKKLIGLSLACLMVSNLVVAGESTENNLQQARVKVIQQYVNDLQHADYKDITQFFVKGGTVFSTSHGEQDAKTFYYEFLPNIVSASTDLHQSFVALSGSTSAAARFHFSYKMKDGKVGDGEYLDEFIFATDSAKLSAVYMFENLHFGIEG